MARDEDLAASLRNRHASHLLRGKVRLASSEPGTFWVQRQTGRAMGPTREMGSLPHRSPGLAGALCTWSFNSGQIAGEKHGKELGDGL